jgi:hypothetical protein
MRANARFHGPLLLSTIAMIVDLQNVIQALRNELHQYGEMLALLEQQQHVAQHSGTEEILRSIAHINHQSSSIQHARERRKSAQRHLAAALQQSENATFSTLIPMLPNSYQPMVSALVQENHELLERVRERAQANQLLLRRALELMQRFITTLTLEDSPLETRSATRPSAAIVPLEQPERSAAGPSTAALA